MNLGVSTASFFPLCTEHTLPIIAQYGATTCEVFFEADAEYHPDFTKLLTEVAAEHQLKITSVHAFCATFEPFLFSNYHRRRQDMLVTYRKMVAAAQAVGATYYTFHGDYRAEDIDTLDYANYQKCWDELLDIGEAHNVTLAWENVSWCQSSRPQFIQRIQQYVDPSRLHYTLDLKQARRASTPVDAYLEVMGDHLVNVHINDFDANNDCLLPGAGQEDFAALVKKLQGNHYSNNLIIEVYRKNFDQYEEIKQSLDFMKQFVSQKSSGVI